MTCYVESRGVYYSGGTPIGVSLGQNGSRGIPDRGLVWTEQSQLGAPDRGLVWTDPNMVGGGLSLESLLVYQRSTIYSATVINE